MQTGSTTTLEIILWVLAAPLLILITFGLVRLLRMKTRDAVEQIGIRIQGYDTRLSQIADFLREFSGINQEPYSTRLDALQTAAADLHTQLQEFLNKSQAFEKEVLEARAATLQGIINAPAHWFQRWQRSRALSKESELIADQLGDAEEEMQEIYKLPWELALQCRQAEKDLTELTNSAQALQSGGARGAALQTILTQIPQIRRAMDGIPADFLTADEGSLLEGANLAATIRVFDVINRIRPPLDRYLPAVREWNTHHQKATTEFAELKQAGANLRQAIAQPPPGLIVTGLQSRLDQIVELAADINQRLAQPDADTLKSLSREISQLRKVIHDTEQQLSRASQQVKELCQLIEELEGSMERLSALLASEEHAAEHPLVFDNTSPQVADLSKRLKALGPAQQPRTPEQIAVQLKEAQAIRTAHKVISESCPKVIEQYHALVTLLNSPDLKNGANWLGKANEMLARTAEYEPRNWSKQDSIQTLPVELDELQQAHKKLIPVDRSAPIKESELSQHLADTQALAGKHKSLRPRVESVRVRLDKIQAMEVEGRDRLTSSFTSLDRVSLLTESNDLLFNIAAAEIDRLTEEIRQLGMELNTPGQGEMEKKLHKINSHAEKVNHTLNNWLAHLNSAIAEQGKKINDRLIQLDSVGRLDEPPVTQARALLNQAEYLAAIRGIDSQASAPAGRLRSVVMPQRQQMLNDLDATAEIKRANDLWQTLVAAEQALIASTSSLLTGYQETLQARTEAQNRLAEAAKHIPERRAWPPNNQSPMPENQALRPIDEKWEVLKNQPRQIDSAILELGRLAQQYRLAAERVSQLINRAIQDEERVTDLEEEITELKQRWATHEKSEPNNSLMREGIQGLMKQVESQAAYIKSQYMLGKLTYEQVIHNLQLLYDELYSARVPVDEHNDIGLNEKHQNHLHQTNG